MKRQYMVEHLTLTAVVFECLNEIEDANKNAICAIRDHASNPSLLALRYRDLANAHRNAAEAYDEYARWIEEESQQ